MNWTMKNNPPPQNKGSSKLKNPSLSEKCIPGKPTTAGKPNNGLGVRYKTQQGKGAQAVENQCEEQDKET